MELTSNLWAAGVAVVRLLRAGEQVRKRRLTMMWLFLGLLISLVGGIVALQALEQRAPKPGEEQRARGLNNLAGRDGRREIGRRELERRRRERWGE